MTERLFAFVSAAFLFGCSGGHSYVSPAGSNLTSPAGSASLQESASPAALAGAEPTEGTLEIDAGGEVPSFLGAIHAVVIDASGEVLGGADEEVANPELARERNLRLVLPAGEGFTVRLTAAGTDAQPSACTASIPALDITAGATARAQVFSWDCDGVSGYVPSRVTADCYWLADWTLVTRTSAAVGDVIAVAAAARGLSGQQPTFNWSVSSGALGTFDTPTAQHAAFRCQAAAAAVPLVLSLSEGGCTQRVTQTVSCY